jgi:hypothetical protein
MAGHRNRLESNVIENNGVGQEAAGIHVRGETCDLIFKANTIRDTRAAAERKQKTGICLEQKVGTVTLDDNKIEADKPMEDQRSGK